VSNYPNLEALGQGCVSGSVCEWPMLKVEARAALDHIERLEAVVRAAENYIDIYTAKKIGRISVASDAYHEARARVPLTPSPTSDGAGEGGTSEH
jgi:hypothetical protein